MRSLYLNDKIGPESRIMAMIVTQKFLGAFLDLSPLWLKVQFEGKLIFKCHSQLDKC